VAPRRVTHPQLLHLLKELHVTTERATQMILSTDDGAFGAKPSAASWSAAEAIVHLTITNRRMASEIDGALADAGPTSVPDSQDYRMDVIGRLLRWSQEPPYRIKASTTPGFVPADVPNRHTVLADFLEQQRAVETVIARAQGHDLSRLKVTSPFNARLRYNLYAALRVITTHNRRHLWQAQRAIKLSQKLEVRSQK
jgi:hypothetical protein